MGTVQKQRPWACHGLQLWLTFRLNSARAATITYKEFLPAALARAQRARAAAAILALAEALKVRLLTVDAERLRPWVFLYLAHRARCAAMMRARPAALMRLRRIRDPAGAPLLARPAPAPRAMDCSSCSSAAICSLISAACLSCAGVRFNMSIAKAYYKHRFDQRNSRFQIDLIFRSGKLVALIPSNELVFFAFQKDCCRRGFETFAFALNPE